MKYITDCIKRIEMTIAGEISTSPSAIDYYATDGSIFMLAPTAVAYPRDVIDVQALVRIVSESTQHISGSDRQADGSPNEQVSERISLTARGNGTDQGGGPINTGIIIDFMRHMDHILEVGPDFVVVQPGCIYERLEDELKRDGRYIPSYPASVGVCTIGGAVANNAAGEKTVKYGATRQYVEAIQVVLHDGSAVWIYPLDTFQLEQKKLLATAEGAIYRQISDLLDQNSDAIYNDHPYVTKESAGYALWEIQKQSMFNLAQLVTGSQGTLCLITAIRLRTIPMPDPDKVTLLVSYYHDIGSLSAASQELHALLPSALEIVDKNLLELVSQQKPDLLVGLLPAGDIPAFVLLAEFDDPDDALRHESEHKALDVVRRYAMDSLVRYSVDDAKTLWNLRRSAAAVMWTIPGNLKALPIIEDGTVPPEKLSQFLERSYQLFSKYDLQIAIWGHAGDADLHMQPFMDLSQASERDKIFRLADEFYAMVHELGGTAAGEHNDSLMRAPYRPLMFGPVLEQLFDGVKAIFDSDNIFNPHKKVGVDFNYIKKHLRREYSIKSLSHMEREQARDKIDR